MDNKVMIGVGVGAVVIVGAIVAGVVIYNKKHEDDQPKSDNRKKAVSVSTWTARNPMLAWAEPHVANAAWSQTACTKDSLGDTMCPEKWEWVGGQNELCAWKGCQGDVDAQGRCLGCPPM